MLRALVTVSFLALMSAGCGADGSSKQAALDDPGDADIISEDEAIAIARAEVPDGEVLETELELVDEEGKDEPPAYEVLLAVGDRRVEVEIHAVTGAVLEVEDEPGDEDEDESEGEGEGDD